MEIISFIPAHLQICISIVRVAMVGQYVAQHATPRSTAQHSTHVGCMHNAATGITHIPSVVPAAIGGQLG